MCVAKCKVQITMMIFPAQNIVLIKICWDCHGKINKLARTVIFFLRCIILAWILDRIRTHNIGFANTTYCTHPWIGDGSSSSIVIEHFSILAFWRHLSKSSMSIENNIECQNLGPEFLCLLTGEKSNCTISHHMFNVGWHILGGVNNPHFNWEQICTTIYGFAGRCTFNHA